MGAWRGLVARGPDQIRGTMLAPPPLAQDPAEASGAQGEVGLWPAHDVPTVRGQLRL